MFLTGWRWNRELKCQTRGRGRRIQGANRVCRPAFNVWCSASDDADDDTMTEIWQTLNVNHIGLRMHAWFWSRKSCDRSVEESGKSDEMRQKYLLNTEIAGHVDVSWGGRIRPAGWNWSKFEVNAWMSVERVKSRGRKIRWLYRWIAGAYQFLDRWIVSMEAVPMDRWIVPMERWIALMDRWWIAGSYRWIAVRHRWLDGYCNGKGCWSQHDSAPSIAR